MRLTDGHDEETYGTGLPDLTKRLEAINGALEEYCATALRLERARAAIVDGRASSIKVSP
jgi:hypothetical protein